MVYSARHRFLQTFRPAGWLPYVLSTVSVVCLAAAMYYIGLADKQLAAAILFLFAVFLIAFAWGRAPAVLAAVASSIMFNYLVVPPHDAFSVPTLDEGVLFIGMLGVVSGLGILTDRIDAARKEAKGLAASARLQKTLPNYISHDFKTLTAVMGSLGTLLADGQHLEETARQGLITPGLTEGEIDVLRGVARGLSDKEIAARLLWYESTVKSHLRTIFHKLKIHNRAQAAAFAIENGLLKD